MNHLVASSQDVQISSTKSMLVQGVAAPSGNSLVITLNEAVLLPAGLYAIRFRIKIPAKRPQLDIWRVAICTSTFSELVDQTTCSLDGTARAGRGAAVDAVFALAGFDAISAPRQQPRLPVAAAKVSATRHTCTPASSTAGIYIVVLLAFASGRLRPIDTG